MRAACFLLTPEQGVVSASLLCSNPSFSFSSCCCCCWCCCCCCCCCSVFAYIGCRVRVVRAWRERQSTDSYDWAEGILKFYLPKYRAVFIHFLLCSSKQDICTPADAPSLLLQGDSLPLSPEETHRGWFSITTDIIRLVSSTPVWRRPDLFLPLQQQKDKTLPLKHIQQQQQQQQQLTDAAPAATEAPAEMLQDAQDPQKSSPTDSSCDSACTSSTSSSRSSSSSSTHRCRSCSRPVYYIMTPGQLVEAPPDVDPAELLASYPSWVQPTDAARAAAAAAAAAAEAAATAAADASVGSGAATGALATAPTTTATSTATSSSTSSSSSSSSSMSVSGCSEGTAESGEAALNLFWGLQCSCCQRVFHAACIRPAHRRIATGGCA